MKIQNGSFVLIRTYSAGVHFGTLLERNGKEVVLKDARRLWSWSGALSLSEIAMNGVTISASKISVPIDEIILTEAVEIIAVNQKSNLPGNHAIKRSSLTEV
jgi:hypothetical protein